MVIVVMRLRAACSSQGPAGGGPVRRSGTLLPRLRCGGRR